MPLEIADLRGSQSMTIGDQDHGRISMPVAAVFAGIVHELFDLASGQVFSDCTVYSVWSAGIPSLIPHRKFRAVEADYEDNTSFLYSTKTILAAHRLFSRARRPMAYSAGAERCRPPNPKSCR